MKRILVISILLVIVGGGVFVSTRHIEPETHVVEKVLPSETFLK